MGACKRCGKPNAGIHTCSPQVKRYTYLEMQAVREKYEKELRDKEALIVGFYETLMCTAQDTKELGWVVPVRHLELLKK